ncbi:gloverin [Amyelois transitella]|uniref:gloverin n=1 Tax=Amyelois transitella TaxID=680683 RepID=UPI00067C308E|nr:gloverin [Amyelois transitella]
MQSIYVLVCLVAAVTAQEIVQAEVENNSYPTWYVHPDHLRFRRQLSADPRTGDVSYHHAISDRGHVFGTLGSRGDSAFGKAGYKHNVFNDGRGKLDATGYGTHAISPYGSSNHFGGRVDYTGAHSKASLDVSKQIHGMTSVDAAAGGRWPIGKNGDFSLQGTYNRIGRFQDYGARAGLNYRF